MTEVPVVLGTVQLGGRYGVANRTGQPDYATAREMVAAALEGGITSFDTAAAYGESEAVLGRALRDLGNPEVTVITKVQPMAGDELRAAVEASEVRLGLPQPPTVLFHREPEPHHWAALSALREEGLVGRAGISVGHDPDVANAWIRQPDLGVVQVPASVLDHRQAPALEAAAVSGVEVHVRSVFLQGLLLMAEEDVPKALSPAIPVRRRLAALADDAGIPLAELAVRYVLGLPGDIRVVLGCETVDQVRQNAKLAAGGPLDPVLHGLVVESVPRLADEVLTPGLWRTAP